jgi:DNA-binding transcriptional LysR family regulator
MDVNDYKILIDLYEYKNITKVANIHYVSQPAITKRIKKIENELNCQLIISNNKGIIFTSFGENIIPYCRQIVEANNNLRSSINQMQGLVGGSVNILASLNYSRYRLPSALKMFSTLYPLVDVNIITDKSKNIYSKLMMENDFIGILRCKHQWDGGSLLLSTEPMCLIYSYENANRPLTDYNYISHNLDVNVKAQIDKWALENKIILNTTKFYVDDITSCKKMVEYGLGWSIVPRICLDDFNGEIRNLYFADGTPFIRETYALYHNSYHELQQVKLFLDVLEANEKEYIYT